MPYDGLLKPDVGVVRIPSTHGRKGPRNKPSGKPPVGQHAIPAIPVRIPLRVVRRRVWRVGR